MYFVLWVAVIGVWGAIIWLFVIQPIMVRVDNAEGVLDLMHGEDASRFGKFRVLASGLKRKMFARLVWISGIIVSVHTMVLPHLTTFAPLIPERYQKWILPLFTVIGIVFEVLAKISPQPVGSINPEIIADETELSVSEVGDETRADPIVAEPTPDQIAKKG